MANEMAEHILLISCIDGRFFDAYGAFMDARKCASYYHCTLAGASLGCSDGCGHLYISEHLATVRKLAPIDTIIIADHRDCGAYRLGGESDEMHNHAKHIRHMARALRGMDAYAPNIRIEGVVFSLDGAWEAVDSSGPGTASPLRQERGGGS
jgi:hypothetical protein